MRVLYCITGLGIGGAEAVTIDIANKMVAFGAEVTLMYLTGKNEQVARIDKRIPVLGLGMGKNIFSFFKAQRKAKTFILHWQPDVVHTNMVHANLFCRLLRLHCHIPLLICTEHNKNIEGRMRMLLYRITDCLSDINTNVSEEATQFFIRQKSFSANKSFTIYNGIDLMKFAPCREKGYSIRKKHTIEEKDFVFLNVGRLMPAKDQKNLITAFHSLSGVYPEVKLLIVGEGELRNDLEQYIADLNLGDRITLVGNQQKVADYYNAADCFVLSSAWEGFGIVLAEAMACELPVIATDSGGCSEVVDDIEYMIRRQDSGALFLKMKQVYEMSEESRRILGRHNRGKAMRFDINRICRQWTDIYEGKK